MKNSFLLITHNPLKVNPFMTNIQSTNTLFLMIHSYKGGTGKTSIAINLAQYMKLKLSKKVLLIEQDIGGPCFQEIFNVNPKFYWNDFYNSKMQIKDLILENDLFDIICANDTEINIPASIDPKTFFIRQLERFSHEKNWLDKHYDIVIFDTHPGYNISLINSISMANVIILVSSRDSDILLSTIELYHKIYGHFQSKSVIFIENQIPEPIPNYRPDSPNKKYKLQLINGKGF